MTAHTCALAVATKKPASSAVRGIGRPPDPGAAGVGVFEAISEASKCVSTLTSVLEDGSCMHSGLSSPGRTAWHASSESIWRVSSCAAKSSGLHAPAFCGQETRWELLSCCATYTFWGEREVVVVVVVVVVP